MLPAQKTQKDSKTKLKTSACALQTGPLKRRYLHVVREKMKKGKKKFNVRRSSQATRTKMQDAPQHV